MFKRVVLSLALYLAAPAWSQVSTTYGGVDLTTTDQMQTPAPVSGQAYPAAVGAEARSNYLQSFIQRDYGVQRQRAWVQRLSGQRRVLDAFL